MANDSPMQRSLELMRARGYACFIVEYWHAFAKQRRDLFGFVDVLCLKKGRRVCVQTTSASNVSARVQKINAHENVDIVRAAGFQIVVHGWWKSGTIWKCREVDLTKQESQNGQ